MCVFYQFPQKWASFWNLLLRPFKLLTDPVCVHGLYLFKPPTSSSLLTAFSRLHRTGKAKFIIKLLGEENVLILLAADVHSFCYYKWGNIRCRLMNLRFMNLWFRFYHFSTVWPPRKLFKISDFKFHHLLNGHINSKHSV